ncbi:hypothetical protein PVT01_000010300 [Plasmodium vivax]|uniref:VIR protein n=1 Tax=Plasmodium vivax TaxID=5855 RepID=A0A1G4ECQ6_PLAVI|nr:hypothetical protein PVT01_000010300 [Plasmodium vivax]
MFYFSNDILLYNEQKYQIIYEYYLFSSYKYIENYFLKYAFFKNFKEYRDSIKKLQNDTVTTNDDNKCNSFSEDIRFSRLKNSKQTCKDFKFLSNSMLSLRHKIEGDSTQYISDCGFLNYWLNDKLRYDGTNGSNYVKNFYDKLKEDKAFDEKNLLNDKIYDIDDVYFKNLRDIYNLYGNLYKIIDIIHDEPGSILSTCSYYTSICIEEYKAAKITCTDESSIFCKALNLFRDSYISVQNDSNNKKGCNFDTSGKLPTDEEILLYRSAVLGGKRPWTKDKIRKLIKVGSNKNEWENQLIHSDIEKKKVHLDKDRYNIEYRSAGNL